MSTLPVVPPMLGSGRHKCDRKTLSARTCHDCQLDHYLQNKDRRRWSPRQSSSKYEMYSTASGQVSGPICPLHGHRDAAGRTPASPVGLVVSRGDRRCRTRNLYIQHSSWNHTVNMASTCRDNLTNKRLSSRGYGWVEPGEGWTRCLSRSRSRRSPRPRPVTAQQFAGPEGTRDTKVYYQPEQQRLPPKLASTSQTLDDNMNLKSPRHLCRVVTPTLEDILPERIQEPPWPHKGRAARAASRASMGPEVRRKQGYGATSSRGEVQAYQETENASTTDHRYPMTSKRWYAPLEEAQIIKHSLGRALSYNKRLRDSNSEMAEMAFALRRKVETMASLEGAAPYNQSTRQQATFSGREYFQHQRELDTAAIKTPQRQNGESKGLRKRVKHFEAFSHEDSLEDCEKLAQRVDDRRPSVQRSHPCEAAYPSSEANGALWRRKSSVEYTGTKKSSQTQTILGVHAQTQTEAQLVNHTATSTYLPLNAVLQLNVNAMDAKEELNRKNLVNLLPTDVVLSEKRQSSSSMSTSHLEEASARVDEMPNSCSYSRVLANQQSVECELRGKGMEAPEIPHTFTGVDARYIGSGSRQVVGDCLDGVLSISRSTNTSEMNTTSSDEGGKFFDTQSRVDTRASGDVNTMADTRYDGGSVTSMVISCTAEKVASASRTIVPGGPGTGGKRSSGAVTQGAYSTVTCRDSFKSSSPHVETPPTPERMFGTAGGEKAPEPKRVVFGVAEKERKGASPPTSLNDDPPDQFPRHVEEKIASLAAFRNLSSLESESATLDAPTLSPGDGDFELLLAFARWRHQSRISSAQRDTLHRFRGLLLQAFSLKQTREKQVHLDSSAICVISDDFPAKEAEHVFPTPEVCLFVMPPLPPPPRIRRGDVSSLVYIATPRGMVKTHKPYEKLRPARQAETNKMVSLKQIPEDEGTKNHRSHDGGRHASEVGEQKVFTRDQAMHRREPVVRTISEETRRLAGELTGPPVRYQDTSVVQKVIDEKRRNEEQLQGINQENNHDKCLGQRQAYSPEQRGDRGTKGKGKGWGGAEERAEERTEGEKTEEEQEVAPKGDVEEGGEEMKGDKKEEELGEEQVESHSYDKEVCVEKANQEDCHEIGDNEAKRVTAYRRECALLAGTAKIVLALVAVEHRKISSRFYRWKRRRHRTVDIR